MRRRGEGGKERGGTGEREGSGGWGDSGWLALLLSDLGSDPRLIHKVQQHPEGKSVRMQVMRGSAEEHQGGGDFSEAPMQGRWQRMTS